jgi:hypothetical protein
MPPVGCFYQLRRVDSWGVIAESWNWAAIEAAARLLGDLRGVAVTTRRVGER